MIVTSRFHTIGFGSRLKRIVRFAFGTGISTFYVVISRKPCAFAIIASSTKEEAYPALSNVLRWPRGCKRGVSQKEAWIREGVSRGLLLENFPYIAGSIEALNYISQAKVTVREDVFEEEKQRHASASASSSSANPSAAVPPVPTTVSVPTGVKIYGAANNLAEWEFEQKDHLSFLGTEPNNTKILFLDFHQVLDRSSSETTYDTGRIPGANVGVVGRIVDYAADRGVKLFVFVLSYTKDRIQHILDALESTQSIIPRLSGVIITPEPTGWSGKSAVINSIRESLNVPGLQTFLVDDSADVLEECYQWLEDFNAVHVKLRRKRSLSEEASAAYSNRRFLEESIPDLERFVRG